MTTASGKYLVIAADTLEGAKRQRVFIEDALKKTGLLPARRAELEQALQIALTRESAARCAADEEDEANKKKGDGGDSGEGGGQQGSSGGSGGQAGGARDESDGGEDDWTDFELFELFLFLMENNAENQEALLVNDYGVLEPLAAATLLFNRNERIAHIAETYTLEQEDAPHSPGAFLPSLERHAAELGARALHLKVHPDAVGFYKSKFGYEPHGPVIMRRGMPVQRMRKVLTSAQNSAI